MFVPKTSLLRWRWSASLALLVACVAPAAVPNATWSARVWKSDEGLPDNTVVGVEQTADGFLWVATQGGLVRFDGVRFREFAPVTEAGVPTSLIHALFLDRRDRLWVAKDRGVVVLVDAGQTTVFMPSNGLPTLEVRMFVEDPEDGLWISYLDGDVLRVRDGRVRVFTAADGLPAAGTCQLVTDSKGQLWFAKGGQVGIFRDGRFLSKTNLAVQRIAAARSGGLWACEGVKVFRCQDDGRAEPCGVLPTDLPNVTPTVLFEDRAGALWIGTRTAGLFRYDGKGFLRVNTSHHEIRSVGEDREGNLWVGTRGGGLDRLRASVVDVVDIGSGVPLEAVRTVCQETTGQLWAATQLGVLTRSQDHAWTPMTAKEGCPVQYVQCVAADPQGGVWIGTQYKGLYHWQGGALTPNISKTNGLANDSVRSLLPTVAGDLWVGTESTDAQHPALQRRRAGQWRTFELPPGSGPVIAMTVDAAGHVWVATSAGRLLRVQQDALVEETASTLAVPQTIRCLLATPDGSLWIGYAGRGVGRLKAGRFNQYRLEQGLADDYISQIVGDGHGRLWFAGNRGIFRVQQRDFDELAAGRLTRLRSVVFGVGDGLPGLQASYGYWPGALRSTDGCLWIPMQSGLALVQAAGLKPNPVPPPVVLERVNVDGQPVAAYETSELPPGPASSERLELRQPAPHLRLRPGHQQVQFEFTALSLAAPANVNFKYRLHGLDQDWVDAGARRVAYYPHLPPGDYRFQVTACNNDGLWNETGAALAVTAEPHFYEIPWFRAVAPVLAFGLVGGGVLLGVRRRHWRQIELLQLQGATERERARIAQDLHDDLGAGLTQISLNTVMAQNPAVTPDVAAGLLHEIDQRARELVTALDEIVWAVNPKNDTLPSLARYFCQFAQSYSLPSGMACRLEVAPALPDAPVSAEQRHHLFLTLKEALHNVLQHSRATEIRLTIAADAQWLTVTLADNGRGFTPAPVPEGADGLHNMADRLKVLGGSCVVTSAPGAGTTVVLRLPLDGTPQ